MKEYLDLIKDILDNGVQKGDRTGTGIRSVFGRQMKFDLRKGFPLLTTKKMFLRGTIEELAWFLRGSVDVKELQAVNVRFWDSWHDDEDTIGNGYGIQMRGIQYIAPVKAKLYEAPEVARIVVQELMEPKLETDSGRTAFQVGDVGTNTQSQYFQIIEEVPAASPADRVSWKVQFQDTGYVRVARWGDLDTLDGSKIKDPYFRAFCNIGYYGEYEPDAHTDWLVDIWREMIRRCYDPSRKSYPGYGGAGVHVCQEWHCFATFNKDVRKIPGWELKLEFPDEYSLDKDTLWASNRYGPHTCMWASKEEQDYNRINSKPFKATNPDGVELTLPSIGMASRQFGLNVSAVHRCLSGDLKTHHGWSNFEYIPHEDGKALRYRQIDQLKQVIASIKHSPYSRRHIISLWGAHDIDRMVLPCCHGSVIQYYVDEGYLHCHTYQRSADVFLGLPVNIASYALLTEIVARHCGLKAGELTYSLGDVHIYDNHVDQVYEQLSRTPRGIPKIVFNREVNPMEGFDSSDFEIVDYDPYPTIKAPVAV